MHKAGRCLSNRTKQISNAYFACPQVLQIHSSNDDGQEESALRSNSDCIKRRNMDLKRSRIMKKGNRKSVLMPDFCHLFWYCGCPYKDDDDECCMLIPYLMSHLPIVTLNKPINILIRKVRIYTLSDTSGCCNLFDFHTSQENPKWD